MGVARSGGGQRMTRSARMRSDGVRSGELLGGGWWPKTNGEASGDGMKDQVETSVPAHLLELLQPTPSGTGKLMAAWDGLTPESQIQLLAAKKKHPGPAYLYSRVIDKALGSENAYVRYLAARECHFSGDDDGDAKRLKERIENDPDPMVRYAIMEREWGGFDATLKDPDAFFDLPHEARLAKVRNLTSDGETVAKLIDHAVNHQLRNGRTSEVELFEILSDYLNKPEFKGTYVERQHSYDGFARYQAGKDIKALWELVLKVPESLSHVIIEHLPESAGLGSDMPKQVLEGMSDRQLQTLFDRSDIGLEKFRKQKFSEITEGGDEEKDYAKDGVRSAAVTHAFDLTNEEFAEILEKPDKPRVRVLKDLAMMACDLRLCLYDAIHDALFVPEVGGDYYEYAEFAKIAFERKLEQLEGWQRDKELQELKLYRLAVQAAPWKKDEKGYPPSGELAFLEEVVVEGDPWVTFINFSKKWDEEYYRTKTLEKHLPKIWEAGEDEDEIVECGETMEDGESEVMSDDESMDRVADDNSDTLTEREAQLLAREWIDNRIGKPPDRYSYSQTRSLMDDLAKNCIAESLRNQEGEDKLCELLAVAWDIVHSVWYAAAPDYATKLGWDEDDQPDEEEARKIENAQHVVWRRRDPKRSFEEGFESDQHTAFNVEELHGTIAMYLERPWLRHPSLDWIFVDMLVSRELCAFGEAIKKKSVPGKRDWLFGIHQRYYKAKGNLEKMTEINWRELGETLWIRFVWAIVIPVGAIWATFYFQYDRTAWALVGIYALIILIYLTIKLFTWGNRVVRRLSGKPDARLKPFMLWDEMYEVWRRLEGPVVNPSRVREAMVRSTEHGAEWDTPTWSLIDRVVFIDPAVWIIWPSRS